jgi:hypothetical protein
MASTVLAKLEQYREFLFEDTEVWFRICDLSGVPVHAAGAVDRDPVARLAPQG